MKAYGVFDGGGVKGAALAGGLAAAEDQKIEFIGFGGTSAGSMVAFLAAVGYSGSELGDALISQEFNEMLDDGGGLLREVVELTRRIAQAWSGSVLQKAKALWALNALLARMEDLGLYSGEKIKEFLLEKAKAKMASLENHKDISFEDLERADCWPLRIVASNILGGRSAIFPRDHKMYGLSVLEAVRASAGYPFAFRPVQGKNFRLVDGGLSSNLPSFLFAEEYRVNRIPTFAFDLITPPRDLSPSYGLDRYLGDLLNTALEAGDELLRDVSDGVVHVPIKVPEGINTLDFGLSRGQRHALYSAGYEQAGRFLAEYGPLKVARYAGDELQKQLMVRYGEMKLYQQVLAALARETEAFSQAKDVRAHLMLPTGRGTLIVVYQVGMAGYNDSQLELPDDAGCCGQAWTTAKPAVADLERMASNLDHWKLNQQQYEKIPAGRRSMMSVPLLGVPRGQNSNRLCMGVLSVDSSTRLLDTGWVTGEVAKVDGTMVGLATGWAAIISRMLP